MNIQKIESLSKEYIRLTRGVTDVSKYTWYSITHHSTSIEGNSLTESQVINLLEYGRPAPLKPFDHHMMIKDHYNALLFLLERSKTREPITPDLIKQTSALVMKNTGGQVNTMAGSYNTEKGEYRTGTVRAGIRFFPDYKKVPVMVEKLCIETAAAIYKAKTFEQKNNAAFMFHFNLVSIHPFGDGNGRTSRLLMNYIQACFNLPLTTVFKSDRLKYIDALERSRNNSDTKPIIDFLYQQHAKFLKKEIKALSK